LISSLNKLTHCPLCQEEWIERNDWSPNFWINYTCNNYATCQMMYWIGVKDNSRFILRKNINDNLTVFWGSKRSCYFNSQNKDMVFVSFIFPFNITEKQLKTYVAFS
jgi:hypothetical protein